MRRVTVKDCNYRDTSKNVVDFIEQDLGLKVTYATVATKPLPPVLDITNFQWYDLAAKEIDSAVRDRVRKLMDLTKRIDKLRARVVPLQQDLAFNEGVRSSPQLFDAKMANYNKIVLGDQADGGEFTNVDGTTEPSLQKLYAEADSLKSYLLGSRMLSSNHDYRIGLTFAQPENGAVVVQYVLSYRIKAKGDGVRTRVFIVDPKDATSQVNFDETRVESPKKRKLYQDPLTGKSYYEDTADVRKFSISAKPGVEYEFRVAAISEDGVMSDWSNTVAYMVNEQDDVAEIDKFIIDETVKLTAEKVLTNQQVELENMRQSVVKATTESKALVDRVAQLEKILMTPSP
jgi:hypothetical protein